MTFKVGTRVQDEAGFTGTVTAQWDDEVEVTFDVSGCTADLKETQIKPMEAGQDAEDVQNEFWSETFDRD